MKRTEKETILDLLGNMRTLHTMLTDSSAGSDIHRGTFGKNLPEGLQEIIGILEQYAEYCYLLACQRRCQAEDVR